VLPSPDAGKFSEAFRLAEGQVPWVAGDEFATTVRFVGLEAAEAEQDMHALVAQLLNAAAEWGAGGRAELTNGRTTIRTPRAVVSARMPRA
jgi:hypothetical protein